MTVLQCSLNAYVGEGMDAALFAACRQSYCCLSWMHCCQRWRHCAHANDARGCEWDIKSMIGMQCGWFCCLHASCHGPVGRQVAKPARSQPLLAQTHSVLSQTFDHL